MLCTSGYVWVGTPLASPTGGTWQNLYGSEAVFQSIPTTAGMTYSICFDYAAQGITAGPNNTYDQPVGVQVFVNGALIYTAPADVTQYTWENACTNFTAVSNSTVIRFAPSDPTQYVAIDGVCVTHGISTGIEMLANRPLSFAPNPCSSGTRVHMPTGVDRITATDASGRIVLVQANDNWLDVRALAPGIYTVQGWRMGERASLAARLVVEPK